MPTPSCHANSGSHPAPIALTHPMRLCSFTSPPPRINNAGTNAYKYGPLLESDDDDLASIVETNVLGVMLCCKEVGRGVDPLQRARTNVRDGIRSTAIAPWLFDSRLCRQLRSWFALCCKEGWHCSYACAQQCDTQRS